jgi:hypothetical protein
MHKKKHFVGLSHEVLCFMVELHSFTSQIRVVSLSSRTGVPPMLACPGGQARAARTVLSAVAGSWI